MFASSGLKERVGLWVFVVFFALSNVESQLTTSSSVLCSSSQLLCGGSICYDPTTQNCSALGTVVQCIGVCGSQCYNPRTQKCFNGTVCGLSEQLCVVKYESSYGYLYNPPSYQCYDSTYQACFNNSLCSHPSRSCNQRCIQYNEVCVNNVTICNVTKRYYYYQPGQIQLCNGACYDSAIQQCVGDHVVHCIHGPSTQECIDQSTYFSQLSNKTSISTSTSSTITTTTTTKSSTSPNCCSVKQCTEDADCCIRDIECQCFQHNNQGYGSCLNPYVKPICAEGCPVQEQCRKDTDCCKCQCAQITVTNTNGSFVTKRQCVPR